MNYYGQFNGYNPNQMYYPPIFDVPPDEKRKIRHNYNVIGITLMSLELLILIVCTAAYIILGELGMIKEATIDGMSVYGVWDMVVGGCFPAILAIVVFAAYCLFSRYNPKELFSVKCVRAGETAKYVLLVLFCQQISVICTIILAMALGVVGLEVKGLNYILEHEPAVYAADIIGSVILAPIGEELIYRGVVLRCSAKVSQRFAIFFSAFIFGIMHSNPYQFVLGFLIGIPLAIVTIKTGSIIPAIICHMVNNLVASVPLIVEYFNEEASYAVSWILMPIFLIVGVVVLLNAFSKGQFRLPEYTIHHKKRTMPIMITSWSMIVVTVIYVISLVKSIGPIAQ